MIEITTISIDVISIISGGYCCTVHFTVHIVDCRAAAASHDSRPTSKQVGKNDAQQPRLGWFVVKLNI